MDSGKETYARKRGYSRVHVLTWTIYLEKNGFVPCSFQNCKFMAFNIVEMKNHYNTCKGEGFQAAYECKYCKGKTEHADKLDEHIVRYHGHKADNKNVAANMVLEKRPKEPDDHFPAVNAKSEISKVIICSWDVSKEMYGYIKCPDCCLLSESVEEMKSHLLTCQKNPSAFAYECQKCNGRVSSQTTLNHHMAECHKDSVLEDDNFIENYSNFWKEQIDNFGFAKCGNKCNFVHIDCSRMKKHFKASCSMEAGCQSVMYCDVQSCSIWSTSHTALLKHLNFIHEVKTSDLKEVKIEEKVDGQNYQNSLEGKLTDRISGYIPSVKCDTINNSQVKDETLGIGQQKTETCEISNVGRFSLETEVHSSIPDCLENFDGWEADSNTKLSMLLKSETIRTQHSKEASEKRPKNDDLYQLQLPSKVENKTTLDDPFSVESEDDRFFVKQSDYSRLEDSASNEMKEVDDDSNSIYKETSLPPEMKAIIDKTRRCYSKMAEVSKQKDSKYQHVTNQLNNDSNEGDIEQRTESQMKADNKNQDSSIKNVSSRQKTYRFTKNYGKFDKNDSLSTKNDTKTNVGDSGMLVPKETNKLYNEKYGRMSRVNKEKIIHEETVTSNVCVTTDLLPGTSNSEENIKKFTSDYKVNRSTKQRCYGFAKNNDDRQIEKRKELLSNEDVELSKATLTEDTIGGDKSLNRPAVSVCSPGEDEPVNMHLSNPKNKNRRGKSKKMSLDVGKDLVENQTISPSKQNRSGGLEPDLEEEMLTASRHEKNVFAENENTKTCDLNDAGSTSFVQDGLLDNSSEPQKQEETPTIISSLEEIGSTSTPQDASSKIQKKRRKPRKISTGSNLSKNSQDEELPTYPSQGKIEKGRSEEKTSDLENQMENAESALENDQEGAEMHNSMISEDDSSKIQKKRGRPRKKSRNMEESVEEIQQGVQSVTEKSGEVTRELGDHSQEVESNFLQSEKIQDVKTIETNCETNKQLEEMKSAIIQKDTSIILQSNQNKRTRPRKISNNNMDDNLEGVVSTSHNSGQIEDQRENSEESTRELEKQSGEVESSCPDSETIENISSSHEDSLNNALNIVTKQRRPKNIGSSSQKKCGRPRKNILDSVRNLDNLVSTPVRDERNSFEDVGELGNNLEEFESIKPEEVERNRDEPIEMSSATRDHTIELKTTFPNEESLNNEQIIEEKQDHPPKNSCSSSHEKSTNAPSSQKKRGRPRKNSLDTVKNIEEVAPTPVQEEKERFEETMGEKEKKIQESESLKPEEVEGNRDESIEMSSEIRDHTIELKTTSSKYEESLNIEQIIEKKQDHPPKNSCSSSHEKSTNAPTSQKKRGRPRKNSLDTVKRIKEVVPTPPLQEERERFEEAMGEKGKNLEESESIKPEEVKGNTEEPIEMSSATRAHSMESKTTSHLHEDSLNNAQIIKKNKHQPKNSGCSSSHDGSISVPSSQKKRGRPRKNSLDSVRNLDIIASTPVQEERECFKDGMDEVEGNLQESEFIKPEEVDGNREGPIETSSEMKSHSIESKTTSHENSHNSSQIIEKRRGRSKNISFSSSGKSLENAELIKPEEDDGNREGPSEMSSATRDRAIELKTTSSSQEKPINNSLKKVKKRGKPKKISSCSSQKDSTKVPSSQKKRGRPRKDSLDTVTKLKVLVPTSTVQEERESFGEVMGEIGKNLEESESIIPEEVEGDRKEPIEKSCETEDHSIEFKTTSHEHSNNSTQIIEKKQRRCKKISSSSHEGSTSVPSSQKKRGRPSKYSMDSVRNLDIIVSTPSVQEERESFEVVIGEKETTLKVSDSSCSKNEEIKEERERPTKTCFEKNNYSDENKIPSSPKGDSANTALNVVKKRGRPKQPIGSSLGKNCGEEVPRLHEQGDIEEQITNDLEIEDRISPLIEEIEEENKELGGMSSDRRQNSEEVVSIIVPSSSNIQKKRGKPKKRKLSQEELLENVDKGYSQIEKSKQSLGSTLNNSNIEDSNNQGENASNEHPNNDSCGKSAAVPNVGSSKSSISIAHEQRIKKKPRRARKTESALIKPSKEIDDRGTKKTPKRNVSKPKKFAQFVTEDSYFDENEQGTDESVPKIQSISVMSDHLDASSSSTITNSNTKKKPRRPKKTPATSASTNDQEMNSEEKLPPKRKRTISKPLKLSSYITDNNDLEDALGNDGEELLSKVTGSSTIADRSEDSLKSNFVPHTLKRRPRRPKKSSITDLDVSVGAENFNTSLQTKQNLCSTPRSLTRAISKPRKYRNYVEEPLVDLRSPSAATNDLSHETKDVSEDFTDQKEGENLSRKNKRRTRHSYDDFINPDTKPKMRKVSNKPKPDGTMGITNEENVEMEPLDKNENYSPVESPKPRKSRMGRPKKSIPQKMVEKITCATCKQSMTRHQFETHAIQHNYFCYIEGDVPCDFEKEEDIHRNFFVVRKYRNFRGFKCEKCGIIKKSSVGYVSHKSMCGMSELERESLKVQCPVCNRYMMPSSLKVHMNLDHRPTTKVAMGEVTTSNKKRAAAARAESRLEDELDVMESEDAKSKSLRKWFTNKREENISTLIHEEIDLDKNNELLCPEPKRSFKADGLDTLQAHHSECSKFSWDYECRICGIRVKELNEIKEHILANHAQIIEHDCSDFELKEDDGEYTDKQISQQNSIQGRPSFIKEEYRTGLNFIYRNLQRTHDRLLANHVHGCSLYKDLLAVPNGFLNEEDLSNYLPNTKESMKISLGNENWDQLKLMEGCATEDASFVFVGGPVWAMDWCPTSLGDAHQWLAVSCHRDMDAVHTMGDVFSYNNVIQIWDFGPSNLWCSSSLPAPSLSIGVAHSHGTVWDMRWCPDGCYQPDSGRLGLLAVAFSSGAALIYSVPLLVTTDRGKPFYKLTPVIELTPPHDEPVQCCRIAWSCDSPFNIVAVASMDGSISLYDITTSSLLLKDGIKIHPYRVFTAHTECITALQFIGNKTGKILMTCSMDKAMKFWNLLDTSAPLTCSRKLPIRDAVWMNNWLCAVSVQDDGYTNGISHLNLNNFRDIFYLQTVPWIAMNNTQWSITASEWSNTIAIASETGEIVAIYPNQLFYIDSKATKKTSMYMSTTVLKKLNSEGNQDHKDEKLETVGPCNYKDAAENYGLVFTENRGTIDNTAVKEKGSKNLFPITSINKISFNPNRQAFTYLAIGHHCGIVRVIRDNHFDFAKEAIMNFSNSLLMR